MLHTRTIDVRVEAFKVSLDLSLYPVVQTHGGASSKILNCDALNALEFYVAPSDLTRFAADLSALINKYVIKHQPEITRDDMVTKRPDPEPVKMANRGFSLDLSKKRNFSEGVGADPEGVGDDPE